LTVTGSVAVGAYAFTESATVPASNVGAGNRTVSGYTISNVSYTLDTDNTTAVDFDLNTAANDVAAALVASPAHGDWVDCGASVANHVSCDFSGSPVANTDVAKLSVVAVSSGTVTLP